MAVQRQQERELDDFQYSRKIKSGVIATILFLILSNKVSYKILDIIINVFTNNVSVIDDNECPQIIGTMIMSVIVGVVIFIF
jgi:hypothetical protein